MDGKSVCFFNIYLSKLIINLFVDGDTTIIVSQKSEFQKFLNNSVSTGTGWVQKALLGHSGPSGPFWVI